MVNHIKTLLLNEEPVSLDQADRPFYVSSSFKPLKLKGSVENALERLFLGCVDIDSKLDRARVLFSLVNRVDLADRRKIYDSRVTDTYGVEVRDSMYQDIGKLLDDIQVSDLFKPTGVKEVDDELDVLRLLSVSTEDGHMSISAKILALVAQIEGARISENGK